MSELIQEACKLLGEDSKRTLAINYLKKLTEENSDKYYLSNFGEEMVKHLLEIKDATVLQIIKE